MIPIISFFTGGGFMDMGFIEAGFDVVFSNEYNKEFAILHDYGMSSWAKHLNKNKEYNISYVGSITEITSNKILKSVFPNVTPSLWGIIGGPPCQDFTMNGKMDGFQGDRGKMTAIFFNRIRRMKPAFFVMENVVGLLSNKITKENMDSIIKNYCSKEYYIDRKVLNALDFGVPQYRQRVFLVGVRKDLFKAPHPELFTKQDDICTMSFNWPKAIYKNAYKAYKWPQQNKFGDHPQKPDDIPLELCVEKCLKSINDNHVDNIDECLMLKKDADKRKEINEGDTHRRSFKRLHRFRFSPTTCYGNNEVHLHPYENRRISVREALRIQGVDDSYILPKGKLSAKFKLIGNGVPVPLSRVVAESLLSFIHSFRKAENDITDSFMNKKIKAG